MSKTIAFYLNEMNYRGVSNSTYNYANLNEKILKNRSIIFFNNKNIFNKKEVINKFKKKFQVIGVSKFQDIDNFKIKKIDFIYVQKGGEKDNWESKKIKTLIHVLYPQKLSQRHGYKYAFISEWLSKSFSNYKIPFVPYITTLKNSTKDLKKKYKIKKNFKVLGYHGGESSFDLKFAQDAIKKTVLKRKDIFFLFLNVFKFCNHPRIKFIKGTINEKFKAQFINTCDAMIYGRSLGESFGHSCGEFIVNNKKIISYKYNRHRSHVFNSTKKNIIEYNSFENLYKILINFKTSKITKNNKNKYNLYKEKNVMKKFDKVFLQNQNFVNLKILDYLINFKSFLIMYLNYLRHKIYTHYYNLIKSKVLNLKKL